MTKVENPFRELIERFPRTKEDFGWMLVAVVIATAGGCSIELAKTHSEYHPLATSVHEVQIPKI